MAIKYTNLNLQLSGLALLLTANGEWDENKVNRDATGKFARQSGETSSPSAELSKKDLQNAIAHPAIQKLQKAVTQFIHNYPANLEKFRQDQQAAAVNRRKFVSQVKQKGSDIANSEGGKLVKKFASQVQEFAENAPANLEKFQVEQAKESRIRHEQLINIYDAINQKINKIKNSSGGQLASELISEAQNTAQTAIEHPDLVQKITSAALVTLNAAINLARSEKANQAIEKKLQANNPDYVNLSIQEAFHELRSAWSKFATTSAERKYDKKLLDKLTSEVTVQR